MSMEPETDLYAFDGPQPGPKPSAASAGYLSVPKKPEAECIESMCRRYDHSFGLKRYIYSKQREETDEEFECRREGTRRIMRQLYEEATGQGFFIR